MGIKKPYYRYASLEEKLLDNIRKAEFVEVTPTYKIESNPRDK